MFLAANLKFLRKRSRKTQDGLSAELKIGRTTIANYEAGLSEPNVETLLMIAKFFGTSLDALLSQNMESGGHIMSNINNTRAIGASDSRMPQVITVDSRGEDNIIYVPIKARAGYLAGYGDTEFIETLPTFRLPGLANATFRMFEIDGVSMSPNILHGDRVIGEWVEHLEDVRDGHVYVVVHEGGVAVKRIINRLKDQGKLYLKSDTVAHRSEFPTIAIAPEEIKEIWYGRLKLSSDFTEPAEVYHRLAGLETDVMEMKQALRPGNGGQ